MVFGGMPGNYIFDRRTDNVYFYMMDDGRILNEVYSRLKISRAKITLAIWEKRR